MTGFILGRSTVQWMATVGATLNFIALAIGLFVPDAAATALIVLNGLGGLAAVYIGFLANSGTTPTWNPILKNNTMVQITDDSGTVIDHRPIVADVPAGNEADPEGVA